ncbi:MULTISPECIES: NDP-hexose 2,3-dehydratase family protein [Streptomyces]|uniref:NDP-hexose 2,3-dehydratase family protein n=1 Tax=Streptomyces katrae TaxID=68223 RepID=A0ABT7GP87_9ACTN|nr:MULTISPECIES: NDP-hexose 2,3-dehydratase family protein [Streptomyces]MDK9495407.1 NDP-hexose 2,3-dehydratase family protein [Streptomyces katrae]GLX23049.1 NDP-hexose 2,3-dehydratase [Streptomyces lavendulae subsp. lavendulae]GLX30511.1 NDP-hexose 2,3-dehydratase [Streptomyces lavendulae subsp. lavendulae]
MILKSTAEFHAWWAERHQAGEFSVRRVPFDALGSWGFDPLTGNLGHASGRFFTVEGLQVRDGGTEIWAQPVIHQPEIGILGILVKEFDGVLHCLMQAKMEPGNSNTLQLSPTVQATRSNYMKVHRGTSTRYLEHFTGPDRGRVLVDVLQSEQGAWFWRKRNRNMVVLATGDVPEHEDFRWLPLELVRELMAVDHLVNMDARTVLSCMPFLVPEDSAASTGDPFRDALVRSYRDRPAADGRFGPDGAVGVLGWFNEAKTGIDWTARLMPLADVAGWKRDDWEITDESAESFRVIAVEVTAGNREVARWTQPLLDPRGEGRAVFVARTVDGTLRLLVRARPEYGLMDQVEMAPTVHLHAGQDVDAVREPFLRDALLPGGGTTRYDQVLSEEGGRFHHAGTRYQIIEVGDDFPADVPPHLCWMTVRQLTDLLRHGHYLNIEARSLLTCLASLC